MKLHVGFRRTEVAATCRPCNVRYGDTLRRLGLGRLTRQYNRGESGATEKLGLWMSAVMSIIGDSDGTMSVSDAVTMIHATPPEERLRFAREIWPIGRRRGRDGIVLNSCRALTFSDSQLP
jgi:hypothetical protein